MNDIVQAKRDPPVDDGICDSLELYRNLAQYGIIPI